MENIREKYTKEELKEMKRKARNEYQRKWRQENKDKVREYNKKHQEAYWTRRALEELAKKE